MYDVGLLVVYIHVFVSQSFGLYQNMYILIKQYTPIELTGAVKTKKKKL